MLGAKPRGLSESPTISWGGCIDPAGGIGGVVNTIQLIKVSDQSVIASSNSMVSGGKFLSLTLDDNTEYKLRLQCADSIGNSSTTVDSNNFTTNSVQFTQACAGSATLCGITSAGALKCWGGTYPSLPTIVPGYESGVNDVACHENQILVVKAGILSTLTTLSLPPVPPQGIQRIFFGITDVGFGSYNACATTQAGVWCWGSTMGGCGAGTLDNCNIPHQVSGIDNPQKIELGYWFSCALLAGGPTGTAKCWGKSHYFNYQSTPYNWDSQSGYNPNNNTYSIRFASVPTSVFLPTQSLAITESAGIIAYGNNSNMAVIWGDPPATLYQVPISGLQVTDIALRNFGVLNSIGGAYSVLFSNGTITRRESSLYTGNSPLINFPSCDEIGSKLLSTEYFLSANGYIRGVGSCSNVSN